MTWYSRLMSHAMARSRPIFMRCRACVTAYLSPHGAMTRNGQPIGLAALEAEGRPHPAATVAEALDHLRRHAKDERSLEEFILAAMADETIRRRLTALIRETALPFSHP